MEDEGGEECIVPSGSLDLASDGALAGVGFCEVHGDPAQDGQIRVWSGRGAAPALPYPLQRLWEKSRWVIGVVLGYIVVKLAWAGLTERPFLDLF